VTETYRFCTDRFCTEDVEMTPGAMSTQHTHASDHIVIPTVNFSWREEPVDKPPATFDFKPGDAKYAPPGVTHRLVNVGQATARMFVVQFK
jgi:oxalate decarboxylase/phosphoglucose isomerase-like protein (cupin superfamily)